MLQIRASPRLKMIPETPLMQFCFSTYAFRTLSKKAVEISNAEEKLLPWEPNLMETSSSLQRKMLCR